MQIQMSDLREDEGRRVDDDGYVYKERESEEQRAEDSDRLSETELQVLEHAGQLQLVKYR